MLHSARQSSSSWHHGSLSLPSVLGVRSVHRVLSPYIRSQYSYCSLSLFSHKVLFHYAHCALTMPTKWVLYTGTIGRTRAAPSESDTEGATDGGRSAARTLQWGCSIDLAASESIGAENNALDRWSCRLWSPEERRVMANRERALFKMHIGEHAHCWMRPLWCRKLWRRRKFLHP